MKFSSTFNLHTIHRGVCIAAVCAAVCSLPCGSAFAQDQSQQTTTAPNDSAQNKHHGYTADQQSNRKYDIALTSKIRKQVIADKSLSTSAHNAKIITRHGVVTLKGPVASQEEKQKIQQIAEQVVGSSENVNNQLTVST